MLRLCMSPELVTWPHRPQTGQAAAHPGPQGDENSTNTIGSRRFCYAKHSKPETAAQPGPLEPGNRLPGGPHRPTIQARQRNSKRACTPPASTAHHGTLPRVAVHGPHARKPRDGPALPPCCRLPPQRSMPILAISPQRPTTAPHAQFRPRRRPAHFPSLALGHHGLRRGYAVDQLGLGPHRGQSHRPGALRARAGQPGRLPAGAGAGLHPADRGAPAQPQRPARGNPPGPGRSGTGAVWRSLSVEYGARRRHGPLRLHHFQRAEQDDADLEKL